jgi:acyl-CoA thioesterase-2
MPDEKTLLSTLEPEELGDGRFRVDNLSTGRGVVLGGQLIAQAILAASRHEQEKQVLTAFTSFDRPAHRDGPVDMLVDTLHSGRAFGTSTVEISQAGRHLARSQMLFHVPEADLIRHATPMPDVGDPEDAETRGFRFGGEENRVLGGVDVGNPEYVGPAKMCMWVRVPDASAGVAMHQALLTFVGCGWLIGVAMLPHRGIGQSMSHREISTGVMSHTITFHDDIDAGEWTLLSMESPFAGLGRTHGRGQAFSRDGRLLASFVQDNIVRNFPKGQSAEGREATIF